MGPTRRHILFLALGFGLAVGVLSWASGLLPSILWLLPVAVPMVFIYPVQRPSRGE